MTPGASDVDGVDAEAVGFGGDTGELAAPAVSAFRGVGLCAGSTVELDLFSSLFSFCTDPFSSSNTSFAGISQNGVPNRAAAPDVERCRKQPRSTATRIRDHI